MAGETGQGPRFRRPGDTTATEEIARISVYPNDPFKGEVLNLLNQILRALESIEYNSRGR